MIQDNEKVKVENLTNYSVGFSCPNYPVHYSLAPGQTISVKWEHLFDAMFSKGMREFIEEGTLRISPTNEHYHEIMEELQLEDSTKDETTIIMNVEEIRKILKVKPLQAAYGKIEQCLKQGAKATKDNFAQVALELGIKDYVVNDLIKQATGIDVIKAIELNEEK